MKQLHVVCAAKGGLGKTLTSLSLTSYYVMRNYHVVGLDLNYTNQDYRYIFTNFTEKERSQHSLNEKFVYKTGRNSQVLTIITPKKIAGTGREFWDFTFKMIDSHKSQKIFVADTHFNIINLPCAIEKLKSEKVEITIWYLYTWSIGLNNEKMKEVREALNWCEKNGIKVIHVFNIYDASFILGRHNPKKNLEKLSKLNNEMLKRMKSGNGIMEIKTDTIMNSFSTAQILALISSKKKNVKKMTDYYFRAIKKMLDSIGNCIPSNLFIIPYYLRGVATSDELATDMFKTIGNVLHAIQPFYNEIERYFKTVRKFEFIKKKA